MGEENTQNLDGARSFEERVFARFDAMDGRFDNLDTRLASVEGKVDALDGRLTSVEKKVDAFDGRLTELEDKVDTRLRETRPIWEAVLARLDGIDGELKSINRRMKVLNDYHLRLRGDVDDIEERVERLESEPTRR